MADVPDFITHYHRPDREPFLNLSNLDDEQLVDVLAGLEGGAGTSRRFGPRYVALRRASEELLRARFIERGGRPERTAHHGEVFLLRELDEVAARHGLPSSRRPDDYTGHQFEDFEHYTEVQVWTDSFRK